MKPHEETWLYDGVHRIDLEARQPFGRLEVLCDEDGVGRLAAQAPAMARAILAVVGSEPITAMTAAPSVSQMRALQDVLRVAGVLP